MGSDRCEGSALMMPDGVPIMVRVYLSLTSWYFKGDKRVKMTKGVCLYYFMLMTTPYVPGTGKQTQEVLEELK